jgi:hypothetical protein
VRKNRCRTGAGHARDRIRGVRATLPGRAGGAASRWENNFAKAPKCIPVFNTPFV